VQEFQQVPEGDKSGETLTQDLRSPDVATKVDHAMQVEGDGC